MAQGHRVGSERSREPYPVPCTVVQDSADRPGQCRSQAEHLNRRGNPLAPGWLLEYNTGRQSKAIASVHVGIKNPGFWSTLPGVFLP